MNLKHPLALLLFLFSLMIWGQEQTPESFIAHRVKARETLYGISKKYEITQEQLIRYNPLVGKVGLKKRMNLRIPVYPEIIVSEADKQEDSYQIHLVQPKETKWRLAYQYGTTIKILETLNPEIIDGLKIGQSIKIPTTEIIKPLPEKDEAFNYYTVKPMEGYYRIEKKLGVDKSVLDSLNPELLEGGLKVGMVLKIPKEQTGTLKIQDDLLIEVVSLIDSIKEAKQVNLAVMLPFKSNSIQLDSIDQTKQLLNKRNLHTISLDFYFGIRMAAAAAARSGITVNLDVFDTQNSMMSIRQTFIDNDFSETDALIGPLIPTNFDYVSTLSQLKNITKVSPLSTNRIAMRNKVFQSVTQKDVFRQRMYEFLEQELDTLHNIVVVADSLNRSIEHELLNRFPRAVKIRPERSGYLLPELVDSLLVDSLPNKVILETESFPLIASALSQMNAQNTVSRTVQVYTTYRGNAYENENLSRKVLGGVNFTYASGTKPESVHEADGFKEAYINEFGKPPNREAIRAYDVTLDVILRIAYSESLEASVTLGETDYQGNRFNYSRTDNGAFINNGYYILQHQGYDIVEIKK